MKGRKIHALVDTLGLPIRLVVHSAAVQDRDGAALLSRLAKDYENLAATVLSFVTLATLQFGIRRLARR